MTWWWSWNNYKIHLREQSVENPWDPSDSVFLGWLGATVSFKLLVGAVAGLWSDLCYIQNLGNVSKRPNHFVNESDVDKNDHIYAYPPVKEGD